jgi:hypothetical protein
MGYKQKACPTRIRSQVVLDLNPALIAGRKKACDVGTNIRPTRKPFAFIGILRPDLD